MEQSVEKSIQPSISLEKRPPTVDEYRHLRESVGWINGDREAQAAGLKNALFSVCLLYNGQVIGCGRVVGDGGNYFYVQDVIVLPAYQERGCGRLIMDSVMEFIRSHAKSGAFIGLMAAKGVAQFYKKYGFNVRDFDRPGMWFVME